MGRQSTHKMVAQFVVAMITALMRDSRDCRIGWCIASCIKLGEFNVRLYIITSIATKVKLFNTICVTILLYGCESWVISQDMENKINAFATSCYRVMLNIKRIDHVLNTTVYSMTNTLPLIHLVRHCQLKFLGHILRMSKEEPARRYTLYIPTIGKRRPG